MTYFDKAKVEITPLGHVHLYPEVSSDAKNMETSRTKNSYYLRKK